MRALIACVAMASGCIKTPAPPQTVCKLDSDCATGRCLAGMCITPETDVPVVGDGGDGAADLEPAADAADDAKDDAAEADGAPDSIAGTDADASADAAEDAETSDALPTCKSDEDCFGKLAALPACAVASCGDGVCVPSMLPDETTCVTDGVCPAPGDCESGTCVAGAPACDDGETCTADQCATSGCNHLAFKNGTPCSIGTLTCMSGTCNAGKCSGTLLADQCLIDGVCVAAGGARPGMPCQRCLPAISQTEWSIVTAAPCDDGDACTTGDACDLFGACTSTTANCDDANPCTDDTCDTTTGCKAVANTAACIPADPCMTAGQCASGVCVGSTAKDCNDANPCTQDQCQVGLGCAHVPVSAPCSADTDPCTQDVCVGGTCVGVPLSSVCKIGGMCVPAGGKADGNDCLLCDPTKNPSNWTPTPSAPCDDANECTFFDVCVAEQCVGEIGPCDDKNPCTQDSCAPESGCKFEPIEASCDDANKCTLGDACVAGKCAGTVLTAKDCDDGNACTDDNCAAAVGCTHPPNGAPCDDGNVCTSSDQCNAGICVSGGVKCACTQDADCNDSNPCTLDHCGATGACSNDILGPIVGCDDGNACTKLDTCATGFCQGLPVNCDDGNACTINGCVAETGCTSIAKAGNACNDANSCTSGDLCVAGACTGTAKNCDDGNACTVDQCDPKTGTCGHAALADGEACPADSVACTADQCVAGTCTHDAVVPGNCLIAGACLEGGTVHAAQACLGCLPAVNPHDWSPMTGLPCSDGSACTQGDVCLSGNLCVGTPVTCDDDNPCTLNGCNPLASGTPCLFVATGGACSDGNACTDNDACQSGECVGYTAICNDSNPCTLETCNPQSGCASSPATGNVACGGDGLPCTTDVCSEGQCSHLPAIGACVIGGACHQDGDPALLPACYACMPAVSQVEWSPVSGAPCSDGDPCTHLDACMDGACVGTPDGLSCDDNNPCTADTCTPGSGACSHLPQAGVCDDGDACTTSDACSGGTCVGGAALACDPGPLSSDCTQVVCDPAVGCTTTSTCGPLHACMSGLCVTVTSAGKPGAVPLPMTPQAPSQPLLPTVRWQMQHAGNKGAIPQLWVTVQDAPCDPSVGAYSRLLATALQPGAATPLTVEVPSEAGWCALHPVLLAHPATATELVLAWVEGGDAASLCPLAAGGGRVRLGLLGSGGDTATAGPPAPCPDAGSDGGPTRPVLHLLAGAGASAGQVANLGGLLVRATPQGPMGWNGNYPQGWGGVGVALPFGDVPGYQPMPAPSRPAHLAWPGGGLLLDTVAYSNPGKALLPAVNTVGLDAAGQMAPQADVMLGSIDLPGAPLVFHAVSGAWDAEAGRVGMVLAGTVVDAGMTQGFLAFHRMKPGDPMAMQAQVIALFVPPADFTGAPVIQAARIAHVPGSSDFLVAYAFPGTNQLQILRIHPLSDVLTLVGPAVTVASDFSGHWLGESVQSSGGLSEIVFDGAGQRYTLVYESLSGLSILTAPIPQ